MSKLLSSSILLLLLFCASDLKAQEDCIPRALAHVRDEGQRWIDERGCVSCHQVPSMIWAHEAAAHSGLAVPLDQLETWKAWSIDVVNFVKPAQKLDCDREATMASNIDTMAAMLLAIPPRDKAAWRTEFANKLASEQAGDGSWKACGQLPMQRRTEIETQATTTLWAVLALMREGTEFDAKKAIGFADSISDVESTEWLAARLLVALEHGDNRVIEFQSQLLDRQNEDGGWGWKLDESSDALGTGYALYSLARTGSGSDKLFAARDYLHRTQTKSGKWIVPGTKKSAKGKPTATANDWGTAWVVIALVAQNLLSDDGRGETAESRTEAERWIQRAVRSSENIKVRSRISHAAVQLARVHARMGNIDAAFETAKRVEKPQLKLYALTATAKAAVDTGQATHAIVDEAKRTLAGNEGAFNNSAMQKLLGIVNQETTDAELVETPAEVLLDELRATFKNTSDRNEKFAAFEPLAFRLLKLELIPELELAIQAMVDAINEDPRPKQSSKFGIYGDDAAIARTRGMHLYIAIALADADKPTEAMAQLELVDPLIDPLPEAAALVKWQLQDVRIRVLLKLGHEKDAIKHLATIQSPLIASRSAASIAVHMIELGDVNAGLTMAQQIGNENGSGDARGDVAIALLQHAETPIAANYLNEIGESDDATAGFISVARHWVESENSDRLLPTFNLLESPVAKTHYAIAAAEFLVLTKD